MNEANPVLHVPMPHNRVGVLGLSASLGCAGVGGILAIAVTRHHGYEAGYCLTVFLLIYALLRAPLFLLDIEKASNEREVRENAVVAAGVAVGAVAAAILVPLVVQLLLTLLAVAVTLLAILALCWILNLIGPFVAAGMVGVMIGDWLSDRRGY